MTISEENVRIAEQIVAILSENKCTVRQSEEILSFVGTTIRKTATVPPLTKELAAFFDGFYDLR